MTNNKVIRELTKKFGKKNGADIKRAVTFAEKVWEGDKSLFTDFCLKHYVPPTQDRIKILQKCDTFLATVYGNLGVIQKTVREGVDIADNPLTPIDELFGGFSITSHLDEDFRKFKIAPLIQLLFGNDKKRVAKTRRDWVMQRLSDFGREKVPASINAKITEATSKAHLFVSTFNLDLGNIRFKDKSVAFPKGTLLVSHWGLRDYMTSLALDKTKLPHQRAIRDLMRRVVDGDIPESFVNSSSAIWDQTKTTLKPIKDKRWQVFKEAFNALSASDAYTRYGNIIDNKFKQERRIDEKRVRKILTDILSADVAIDVGRFVSKRLGRPLEAHDIYFEDFHEKKGDKNSSKTLAKRFPNAKALELAIPTILIKLGVKKDRAYFIASKIRVDNSRSAGHAWPPHTKNDLQLCRVQVGKKGISKQDFSTFMHELGHCVEGVLTSYEMDYHTLWSVPNTACTEAFAFTFQDKADFVLGIKTKEDSNVTTLLRFWEAYEIAGPALVELDLFRWLYKNKNASASAIMKKVREIGDDVWRKYYARVLGKDGYGLMSVYSHMLDSSFYLAEYPLGLVIAYQIRKFLKGKNLGIEMQRICSAGSIDPDPWMKLAVGEKISVAPLLNDTKKAIKDCFQDL